MLASRFWSGSMNRRNSTMATERFHSAMVNTENVGEHDLPSCAEPLGKPLPLDEHACSVSLPTWSSVVGYEEGMAEVTSQMSCGYPRFVYHPYIIQLMEYAVDQYGTPSQDCLVLPTPEAAKRCQVFLQQALFSSKQSERPTDNAYISSGADHATPDCVPIRRVSLAANVEAVLFPAETMAGMEAKAYWQHTGEIVSSRRAETALRQLGLPLRKVTTPYVNQSDQEATSALICHGADQQCDSVYPKLKERIAELTNVPPDHVHLTATGMSSIYTALRASRRVKMERGRANPAKAGGTSIVFGFPYLDTLKLCSRAEFCPAGVEFFGHGEEDDLDKLEQMLSKKRGEQDGWCALFTEVPSNPLLLTPDVRQLRKLANEHGFALVVDDTIGNFANVDLLGPEGADMVCTSLTKLFSGRGDAMGGSVVVNPETPMGQALQEDLEVHHSQETPTLFTSDAWAIYHNSVDFLERNEKVNETAERLSDWLQGQPEVDRVFYPKYTTLYNQVQTGRGYGGLLSLLLQSHVCQRTFFDALDISKGPSLGTNFTLMCPYTLLAHYHELDFAMAYNVQPNLLRLSVGMEDLETLRGKFERAFRASRLHPPLPTAKQLQDVQKRMYHQTSGGLQNTRAMKRGWRFLVGRRLFL